MAAANDVNHIIRLITSRAPRVQARAFALRRASKRRSLSELVTTNTLENDIAAAAMIGFKMPATAKECDRNQSALYIPRSCCGILRMDSPLQEATMDGCR